MREANAGRDRASRVFDVGGLRIHYLDYGGEGPVLLFVHGGQDHAHSWDFIAPELTGAYRVFAVDLRGHGDSDWVPGGLYTPLEYVLDLALLSQAFGDTPLCLVGHSLGSTVCLRWASLQPGRILAVAAIEGFGPSPTHPSQALPLSEYLRAWLDARLDPGRLRHRTFDSVEAAADRMRDVNSRLSPAMARHLAAHGTRRLSDGRLTWKFDPVVRLWAPYGLGLEESVDLYSRVECPVLVIRGVAGAPDASSANPRVQALRFATIVDVEGAGHWVHHDAREQVLAALRAWLPGVSHAPSRIRRSDAARAVVPDH